MLSSRETIASMLDGIFFKATGNAIDFLTRLDSDADLAAACSRTDFEGRLALAARLGYSFKEENLRVAIRTWDFHGRWRRWLGTGRLSTAVADLPLLDDPYPLDQSAIDAYQRDGHVRLPGLISREEMAQYRAVIRRAVDSFSPASPYSVEREQDAFRGSGFIYAFNLRQQDEAVLRLVLSRRLAKVAADLMGVDRVRVYQDEAFYKEAGAGPTHWHQDRLYFPAETDQMLAIWIPIADVTAEMGTLDFASGSHRHGYFGYHPVSEEGSRHFDELISERGFPLVKGLDMSAGDATCHNGWTLHGAGSNRGKRTREAMTILYYPDGTRLSQPLNAYHQRAIELAFRSKPGELAESPIHPLVYDRRG